MTVTDVTVLLVAMVVGLLIIVEVLVMVEIGCSLVAVSVVSEAVLVVLPVTDLVPVLVPLCSVAVEDGSLEVAAAADVAVDNAVDVVVVATSDVETVETVLVTVVALPVLEVVRVKV